MTDKEYRDVMSGILHHYIQISEMIKSIKDANYAYPIGVTIAPYNTSLPPIQMSHWGNQGDFEYKETDYYEEQELIKYSSDLNGTELFYLMTQEEKDNYEDEI